MNAYAAVVLASLVLSFIVGLIAQILNLKALRDELSGEFAGVYDADPYRKSQEYTRAQTRFGFVTSTFGMSITLAFWFAGGFNYLDVIVRGWELNPILTG